jgi:hypothetical protein
MKLTVQVKAAFALVIALTLVMMVSCARPLSLPVTASGSTPISTATALAYTATPTNTACSVGGNTCTFTATSTTTNTYTATATATITNTPLNTYTPTITMTMTNTPALPTATPGTNVDFDDFDETSVWTAGPAGWNFATSPVNGASCSSSIDNVNYYGTVLCSTITSPQSGSMTITTFGAGVGASAGVAEAIIQSSWPLCNNATNGTNVGTIPGNSFSMMVLGQGGPLTIANVYLKDSTGDEVKASTIGFGVADGVWTNCVVPMASFAPISGTLSGLKLAGPYAIYIDVTGPVSGTGSVNFDNIFFY